MQDPTHTDEQAQTQRKREERRAALKTLGVVAAYAAPVLIATAVPTQSARASGSPPSNNVPLL